MPRHESYSREQLPESQDVRELKPGTEATLQLGQPHDSPVMGEVILGHDEAGMAPSLQLVDLSNLPLKRRRDGKIYREYKGGQVSADIDVLAVDPTQLDWEQNRGYKGIRAGESVVFGRGHMTDRFGDMPQYVSRNHVGISLDESGALHIADLGSSNGTHLETPTSTVVTTEPLTTQPEQSHTPRHELGQRTLPDTARIVTPEEVAEHYDAAAKDPRQPELTRELIASDRFIPQIGVEEAGREFAFSKISTDTRGRKYSVGYTDNNGEIQAHMYYKSNSDGGWRVASYVEQDGRFNKGETGLGLERFNIRDEYGQYTQVGKPIESVSAMLEAMEHRDEFVDSREFNNTHLLNMFRTHVPERILQDEVNIHVAKGKFMGNFVPGRGYIGPPEALEHMQLPAGFEPDFHAQPMREFQMDHSILGPTDVQVFNAEFEGRPIEWEVARNAAHDTVWVDRITFTDGDVTPYGTERDVILAGALNIKPVDYDDQINIPSQERGEQVADGYISLKPTIDKMPWARRYRAATNRR